MAVHTVEGVNQQVEKALEAVKERAVKNVFFVACGGSSALMYPSKYVIDHEAKVIDGHLYSSNEFIHRDHAKLNRNSVVILCSHSGNTPETVKAAEFAEEQGALVISLTHLPDSPLAQASSHVLKYEWGKEADALYTNYSVMYQIVFGILEVVENNDKRNPILRSLANLQSVYDKAVKKDHEKTKDFADRHKFEKVIYTMASGSNYGVAYSFAICILMEMQWIHSHAIHSGEFFHGPFEIIDEDTPFIVLLGLDQTRPLEERSLKFAERYGKKLTVLDAKDYDLSGIAEEVKSYMAPLVLNHVLREYAEQLADVREHPLSKRRYMWKVDY